jgi:hypothetical protein
VVQGFGYAKQLAERPKLLPLFFKLATYRQFLAQVQTGVFENPDRAALADGMKAVAPANRSTACCNARMAARRR